MNEAGPSDDESWTPEELAEINRQVHKLVDEGRATVRTLIDQIKRAESGLPPPEDQPPKHDPRH